jgi:hypothetical protein
MPFNKKTQQQQKHDGFLIVPMQQNDSSSSLWPVDDDWSTSSTIAAACFQQEKTQIVPQQQLKTKHVHFNEAENTFHDYTSVLDKEDIWYSLKDLQQFKSSMRNSVREIVRNDRLDSSATSYQKVLERAYDACCHSDVLSKHEEQHVEAWCPVAVAASRLGLERFTIRSIFMDCANRKRNLAHTVLQIQELAMSNKHMSRQVQMKLIRQASVKFSRPSRLFAQQLAQAHAQEAQSPA